MTFRIPTSVDEFEKDVEAGTSQVKQKAGKVADQTVQKAQQAVGAQFDNSITNFLYGASEPAADNPGDSSDSGIEQIMKQQGGKQVTPHNQPQLPKQSQQKLGGLDQLYKNPVSQTPDSKTKPPQTPAEVETQKKKMEEKRVHERNYFDDLQGALNPEMESLELQVRRRIQEEQKKEEERKKQEEQDKEEKEKEEKEQERQQIALPSGKTRQGVKVGVQNGRNRTIENDFAVKKGRTRAERKIGPSG